jgi:hypothetical protein
MEEYKRQLQIIQVQLETLATLDSVKMFLQLQEKAGFISELIKKQDLENE